MAIANNDIIKVVLDYAYPGAGTALNILHYVYSGPGEEDEDVFDALLNYFTNDWATTWEDLAATNTVLDTMAAQVVSGTGIVLRDLGTDVIGHSGVNPGEVNPAAVAGYMQANTASPQIRGSKYIPGLAEAIVGNGELTAPGVLSLGLLLVDYLANITVVAGSRLLPGVVSAKTGGFVTFTDSGTINSVPAYQRRRKPGVGI